MQLRSFKSYANVAPYVAFAQPCALVDLDGTIAVNGANAWLQLFDLTAAPVGGTVPLKSWFVPQSAAIQALPSIFQELGPIRLLNGLVLAMSSTEATYTAVATAFDALGEISEFELPVDPPTTAVGDLVTGLQSQQVWSEASNAAYQKSLIKVTFTNTVAAIRYVALFATDGMSIANDKLIGLWAVPASGNLIVNFGTAGAKPFQLNQAGNIPHRGCSFLVLDTINPLHADAAADVAILSVYKTYSNE